MAGFGISTIGANVLIGFLRQKSPFGAQIASGITNMALRAEALIKKSTPVDTGRLRSSITTQSDGMMSRIGTNVEYASFVEYGTHVMEPRHVEGTQARVLGKGPFAYAMEQLGEGAANTAKDVAADIENAFKALGSRGFIPKLPGLGGFKL
jgi:hypothetical protein